MDDDNVRMDQFLVENWIDALSETINRRLSGRELDRRLARITGKRSGLMKRLSAALRTQTFRTEWRRRRDRETAALQRLDRALRNTSAGTQPVTSLPSIEQIAHDLRRLDRQRRAQPTTESPAWLAAVTRAYDQRLALACRALGLADHLDALEGIDRDIERIRIEAALQEYGYQFRST